MKWYSLIGVTAVSLLFAGLSPLNAQNEDMDNKTVFQQMFPQGEKLPEQFSKYFIGQA